MFVLKAYATKLNRCLYSVRSSTLGWGKIDTSKLNISETKTMHLPRNRHRMKTFSA